MWKEIDWIGKERLVIFYSDEQIDNNEEKIFLISRNILEEIVPIVEHRDN